MQVIRGENTMGCCLFAAMLAGAPRFAFIMWWLFQPARVNGSFTTIFWPLLGLMFFPWTTIMWVIVIPAGINGFDWIWLGIALLIDLGTYAGNGKAGRDRYRSN